MPIEPSSSSENAVKRKVKNKIPKRLQTKQRDVETNDDEERRAKLRPSSNPLVDEKISIDQNSQKKTNKDEEKYFWKNVAQKTFKILQKQIFHRRKILYERQ